MRTRLVRSTLRGLSLVQVRHVKPVAYDRARGGVAQVYRELERDFGVLAPPIALHSPSPDVLAAGWLMLRETLLVRGAASRAIKEAVASAVSAGNECPFCVRMHSTMLGSLVHGKDATAIAEGRLDDIADPRIRAVAEWTARGSVRDTAGDNPSPVPAEQLPELIGVAVDLHYLNRMVNVFLGGVPLPPGAPEGSLKPVLKVLMWLLHSASRTDLAVGTSLALLPPAPLAEDLGWARGNPGISAAYARSAAAIEEAGRRSVPEGVRELVHSTLDHWDGRPPGLGRGWVDDAVGKLAPEERPAGRLALLTALASYQVDEGVIAGFRAVSPEDSALVDLTAWASLTAARRIGGWLRNAD
ncbi:carboxymuconolactone decarboxylase family protein [Kitasatospora paracochleata]|uniref:AhpD family alkylhydroperoxidase n=1 Tax=Kitasatospora paracochleata TaxID=58354 RepID=A0ABT1IT38_9ACTN|nr:carboxymuconolactone decarboxylase family protein [Kitasatospora paracochleata]MCP2308304.1 AhpD family alkylhydroperoxidase [Kitasatospora paracochleata]